jgi:hypothetical protein
MAEPGLTEVVTTIGRNRQKQLRDNVTNNNFLLSSMDSYETLEEEDGGRTIVEEMAYAENSTFLRYSGAQLFSTSFNPTMTSAEFDWKQFGCAVTINGREERMNSGSEAFIKLLTNRFKIAEMTLENNYNADLLSDGTSDSGLQIGGLKFLVAKTNTNTVGGIDRSTTGGAFFKNLKVATATDAPASGVATSASNIEDYYTYMILNTTRGSDRTKVIYAGDTHYRFLMKSMQAIQRIADAGTASAGFKRLVYQGIPVEYGGGVVFGSQSLLQADLSYFLNTKFLKVRVHRDANMEPLPEVQSINSEAKVQLIVWMGNMTMSDGKVQGVIYDS